MLISPCIHRLIDSWGMGNVGKKKKSSLPTTRLRLFEEVLAGISEPSEIIALLQLVLSEDEFDKTQKRWLVCRQLLLRGTEKTPSGAEIARMTQTDVNYVSRRVVHFKRMPTNELNTLRRICELTGG